MTLPTTQGAIQAPKFTETALASGTINKGCGCRFTTDSNGTKVLIAVTSGYATHISCSTLADGDVGEFYKMGSEALVALASAVSDLSVPLMVTTGGKFTVTTADKDVWSVIPLETSTNAGNPSFIRAFVSVGNISK